MLLTEAQMKAIMSIIEKAHTAFVVNAVGPAIEQSYLYGQLLEQLGNPAVQKMSYEEFKRFVEQNPIALTPVEKDAIKAAKLAAGNHCQGLGNKVGAQVGNSLIEADAQLRQKLRDTIKTKTAENIARRETVKKLKSELGWATKDWARDWDRIAITEKHNAHQQGVKDQIAKKYGPDALVFKRPMPDACRHCKRLHLGPDGHPMIFKLADLEANGTNVGKKVADWLPVVGAVHPHCQCQLVRMPAGWGFDEDGSMVPGGEFGQMAKSMAEWLVMDELRDELHKALAGGGHVEFQNLPIFIENPAGSRRRWTDGQGNTGETLMMYAYGEIVGTEGADGDPIDVFLGPDPKAKTAYIVHQQDPVGGRYDEDKVMLGFPSEAHAIQAYRAHYNKPGFDVACTPMAMDAFKRWAHLTSPNVMSLRKGPRLVVPLQDDVLEKGLFSRKPKGPFMGPKGGKWADPEHTIPWKEGVPTDLKHPMVGKQQMVEAAHKAVAAGCDVKSMKLVGAGMEGILFKDDSGKAFKVWRPREGSKKTLKQEASALEALQQTPAAKVIPKFHGFNEEHNVIIREHVEGQPAKRTDQQGVREAWELIAQETEKLGLGVPEFNETAFITNGDKVTMVDLGDMRKRGSSIMHKADTAGPIYYGPRGGKYKDAALTIPVKETQALDAKVRPHKSDSSKVMLKVPHSKAKDLAALKQKYNLPDEITVGGQYVMLAVPKSVLEKPKKGDKPATKKKPPPQKKEPFGYTGAAQVLATLPHKFSPHKSDPNTVMLKMPVEQQAELEKVAAMLETEAPIKTGGQYVMLPLSAKGAASIQKKMAAAPKAPAPKPATPAPATPAVSGKAKAQVPPYASSVGWTAPQSTAEAKEWCANLGIAADFPDLATAVSVTKALSEQHPSILQHIQFIGTPAQQKEWAKANPAIAAEAKIGKHAMDITKSSPLGPGAAAVAHPLTAKPYTKSMIIVQPSYYNETKATELKSKQGGFSVSESLGDIVRHECGHVEAFQQRHLYPDDSGKQMWEIWKKHAVAMLKGNKKQVIQDVSQYGATNPHELWAEISVLRRKGVPLAPWIQDAITEMGIDEKDWSTIGKVAA